MKKRDIVAMIIFSIITCGIYNLFWIYLSRSEFAAISGKTDVNPGLELVLCIICFPYLYYWIYKFSSDIAAYQEAHGLPKKDNSLLNLILVIFGFGLISELLIQDQLNELV